MGLVRAGVDGGDRETVCPLSILISQRSSARMLTSGLQVLSEDTARIVEEIAG